MKKVFISGFLLIVLFMSSFVPAVTVSGSAESNFSYEATSQVIDNADSNIEVFWKVWNSFSKTLSVLLIIFAIYLIYELRKSSKKGKISAKTTKKVVKPKTTKKVVKNLKK